ncbi:MAG: cell division protein FtsI, partial [Alistipes sp.]|nr:cell division protein FtsI [Alistipes sp.]
MNELKKRIQADIIGRMKWIHLALVLITFVIFGRLVWIQYADSTIATVSERLHKSIITKRTVRSRRGSILSRDGQVLATSIFRNSIAIDFGSEGFDNTERFLDEADSLAKMLERHFGVRKAKEYFAQMKSLQRSSRKQIETGTTTVRYSKGFFEEMFGIKNCDSVKKLYTTKRTHTSTKLFGEVDDNEWEVLSTYPILNGSLGTVMLHERIDSRIYPQGNLARRVIGRTDRKSPYGIEYAYRDSLAGEDGYDWVQYVARNFYATYTDREHRPKSAVNGMDIVTTLDIDVQDVADRALRESLAKHAGIWGTTIVMECATGDILAMVNLERGADGEYFEGRNYAIGGRMEPGSTIKLATTITLLDDAKMSPMKRYHSGLGGIVKVTNHSKIQDSHPIGKPTKGRITLETAFAESANVYFAKAVNEYYKDNPQRYVDALKRLHLHERVGFEEFGSVQPLMPSYEKRINWSGSTLCRLAYGYGLEVTPLNTITLYNAIA